MAWFISDHHFNHIKVIEYCNREFNSMNDMNEHMINEWNKVVKEGETVYHLGDFIFYPNKEKTEDIVRRLNGDIILVKGNHDRKTNTWYKNVGMVEVYSENLVIGKYVLSHRPIKVEDLDDDVINIHGHLHKRVVEEFNTVRHVNVSVDVRDYKPIWIDLEDEVK